MNSHTFYDAIIFKSGNQDLLFSSFDYDEMLFPADWHSYSDVFYLSVELLPHRKLPYIITLDDCDNYLNTNNSLSWAKIIPYSGFCVSHSYSEYVGSSDDHVFYLPKNKNDVRGIEIIVNGSSKIECLQRMNELFSNIDALNFVHKAFSSLDFIENELIIISPSIISGSGVFAKTNLPKGSEIETLTRPLVKSSKIPQSGQTGYGHNIQIQKDWWLPLNHSSFYHVNHSCSANVNIDIQGTWVNVVARRNIMNGEELLVNYESLIYADDDFTFKCNCNSTDCSFSIKGMKK